MKNIKLLLVVILIFSQSACSTISAIFELEYDAIIYQGETYSQEYKWIPVHEPKQETVDVSLVFNGKKISEGVYHAKVYTENNQTVFLSRNGKIFKKKNFIFPEPTSSDLIIDHLVFIDDLNKTFTSSELDLISGIIESYNHPGFERSSCKFVDPVNYEIIVFYEGYFASYDLGSICDDSSDRFGFRDFKTGGKATVLFPQTVNDFLKEMLKQ